MTEQVFLDVLDEEWSWHTLAAWHDWLLEEGKKYRAKAVGYVLKKKLEPQQSGGPLGNVFFWPEAVVGSIAWSRVKEYRTILFGGHHTRSECLLTLINPLEAWAEFQGDMKVDF